jgi:hypothetical protein
MVWTDLKDIQVPLRVGDVVILPGTPSLPTPPIPPSFALVFQFVLMESNGIFTWSR